MAEQEQIREVLSQLATLQQQQSALQQQVPSQSSGFLNKDQEGLGDVLRNPDQAQIDFAVNAGLGLLNPNTRAPVIQGAVQGLSALQARRAGDLAARQSAHRQATSILKDRIDNLSKQGTLLKQSADIGAASAKQKLDERQFTETKAQNRVQNRLADSRLTLDMLKEGDVFEDQVGQDEFGNPVTAQFRYNPVTQSVVQLTGNRSTTTPARKAELKALTNKARTTFREGSRIFFDKDLHQIFGPLEARPLLGGLTEGAVGGKAKSLKGRYERFVQQRILDVARVLAPVTEIDVQTLEKTLAPGRSLGNAEEAREFFVNELIPKTVSELRFAGAPSMAFDVVQDLAVGALEAGASGDELGSILGNSPMLDEIVEFAGDRSMYTAFDPDDPLSRRAIPGAVIEAMAKRKGQTVKEFTTDRNIQRVR